MKKVFVARLMFLLLGLLAVMSRVTSVMTHILESQSLPQAEAAESMESVKDSQKLYAQRPYETTGKSKADFNETREIEISEYYHLSNSKLVLTNVGEYDYQKLGKQVEYKEYAVTSKTTASLYLYILEGYDERGSLVYQWEEKSEDNGGAETHSLYTYDEEDRVVRQVDYINGRLDRVQSWHYYENGMSACAVQIYHDDLLDQDASYDVLYDTDGQAVLYKAYGEQAYYEENPEQEPVEYTVVQLGEYDWEELAYQGDKMVYYRWYNHNSRGQLTGFVQVAPWDETTYHAYYVYYEYDDKGRPATLFGYHVQPDYDEEDFECRWGRRWIDGKNYTALHLYMDERGNIIRLASTLSVDEYHPLHSVYEIAFSEDGSFILTNY